MLSRLHLVLVVAALVGCTSKSQRPAASYSAVIAAQDIEGKTVGQSAKSNATIVVFFATWCEPCRQELDMLTKLRTDRPNVRIIGVNAYEEWSNFSDERKLRAFLAKHASWLQVVRADKRMFKAFGGVPKIPSMFIFDGNGNMVKEFRRAKRPPPSRSEVESVLSALKTKA